MKEQEIKNFISREIEFQLKSIDSLQSKDITILLKNYNKYKNTIKYLEGSLFAIENGTYEFIKNSDTTENVQHSLTVSDPLIKIEDKVSSINAKLVNLKYIIFKLESAFSIISSDKYYELIKKRYLESKCVADILNELNISYNTYKTHHKRLLNEIKSLFLIR
ncbi:hypothetical protein [uncultured Sneathia sp.]|uniref:hypothetical protein n=1 Tax=uncultured Sneathia sp. TaxID=278067 RepID=UPI0025999AD4|nr:hypothetical protein [uncultured Sneathia sp.]